MAGTTGTLSSSPPVPGLCCLAPSARKHVRAHAGRSCSRVNRHLSGGAPRARTETVRRGPRLSPVSHRGTDDHGRRRLRDRSGRIVSTVPERSAAVECYRSKRLARDGGRDTQAVRDAAEHDSASDRDRRDTSTAHLARATAHRSEHASSKKDTASARTVKNARPGPGTAKRAPRLGYQTWPPAPVRHRGYLDLRVFVVCNRAAEGKGGDPHDRLGLMRRATGCTRSEMGLPGGT